MKRPSSPHRPAGLALCLVALLATGGCTRFRYAMAHPTAAAAERIAREEAYARSHGQQVAEARPAEPAAALPAPPPAPLAAPAPEPASSPEPASRPATAATPEPQAEPAGPSPAERHRAEKAAQRAERAQAKAQRQDDKAERHAEQAARKARPAPADAAPLREAVPLAPAPAPRSALAPAPAPRPYVAPSAPPTAETFSNNATVIFANTPGTRCGACETVKLSVTPSGQVLIERGHWTGSNRDWRYRKTVTHVPVARAAAFARQLAAFRVSGDRALANDVACPAPATLDDGLTIDWIEAGHHDRATISFACPAQSNGAMAQTLRQAPALLGLSQLGFPWETGR